jgi:hypothetical protein
MMMLDWIATFPDHGSQLFRWHDLQQWLIQGNRLPGYSEAEVRRALGQSAWHGACRALLAQGRSLLPVGVTAVAGTFDAGDLVTLVAPSGAPIGRGLTNYSSAQLAAIRGRRTNDLAADCDFAEVIHRNNMVLWT